MKNRRTYASLKQNIQCRYNVNGKIMGSTLNGGRDFKFDIVVNDPDTNNFKNKIQRLILLRMVAK
jgi:hypothetical protein